jgi:hypothetical protein
MLQLSCRRPALILLLIQLPAGDASPSLLLLRSSTGPAMVTRQFLYGRRVVVSFKWCNRRWDGFSSWPSPVLCHPRGAGLPSCPSPVCSFFSEERALLTSSAEAPSVQMIRFPEMTSLVVITPSGQHLKEIVLGGRRGLEWAPTTRSPPMFPKLGGFQHQPTASTAFTQLQSQATVDTLPNIRRNHPFKQPRKYPTTAATHSDPGNIDP